MHKWRLCAEMVAIFVLVHGLAVAVVSWATLRVSLPTDWGAFSRLALLVMAITCASLWPRCRGVVAGLIGMEGNSTGDQAGEGDEIDGFLSDCVEISDGPPSKAPRVAKREMFDLFESWCAARGAEPLGMTRFGKALRAKGIRDTHSNGALWVGVSLKGEGKA